MDELTFEDFKAEYQRVPVEEYPNRVCETMPDPVVSVHVGTYQHANFIRDCIEGVLMQETDFPFEIVIGEDESDDGTREICKEYADRHPEKIRLLLHRRENNIAIHGRPTPKFQQTYSRFLCRGKYIAICQGDDYWTDPLKLQKQVDFLEANPEYVLSHHDASIIDADGKQLSASKLPDDNKRDFSREELMEGAWVLTLTLVYRNNVVNRYPKNFYDVLNSDTFLISLLGQHGKGYFQRNIAPAMYRVHSKSIWSSRTSLRKAKTHVNTFSCLKDYYKDIDESISIRYKKWVIDLKKDIYNMYVEKINYKGAFWTWLFIVSYYVKNKEYRQAISFFKQCHILLGHMLKRFPKL